MSSASRPLSGYALTNHFRKVRQRVTISHLQAYLFFELIAVCGDVGWPDEFSATNATLMAGLGCTEEGLNQARKRLREVGLIDFVSGKKGVPTCYRFTVNGPTHLSHTNAQNVPVPPPQGSGELGHRTSGQSIPPTQGATDLDHTALPHAYPPTVPPTQGSGELGLYKELTKSTFSLAVGEGGRDEEVKQEVPSSAGEQPSQAPAVGPGHVQGAAATSALAAPRPGRKRRSDPTPAELLPDSCSLALLLNPGGLAAKVQRMAEPLTLAEADRLLADFGEPALRAIFCEMANYPKLLTNSTSANLTARNWLARRGGQRASDALAAPARPAPPPSGPPVAEPELNPTVVAQREAQRQAEADERARRFRATQVAATTA